MAINRLLKLLNLKVPNHFLIETEPDQLCVYDCEVKVLLLYFCAIIVYHASSAFARQ